jgi:phytanoyl-CoA dioxygenase PhyH
VGRGQSPLIPTRRLDALVETGFVMVPGPVPSEQLAPLAEAYDRTLASADLAEVSIGRSTTRLHDLVNRGAEFDPLYVHDPALEAGRHVLGPLFKLSSLLARTLRPHTAAQDLHVDVEPAADGWAMLGFIFMVDAFRADNGATRFVPGSHHGRDGPEVLACGPAGSMILYSGSVWHGHAANVTDQPRRSIQGAYIRREAPSATDFAARMRPETLARLGPVARTLLYLTDAASGTSVASSDIVT